MTDNKLVIIATQAATGKPAYRRDLLTCLAYPNDQLVSFLYRRKWISHAVLQPAPAGRRALLVYCYRPQHDHDTGSTRFNYVPVRFAHLVGLGPTALLNESNSTEDTYLTASFSLGNFVEIAPNTVKRTFEAINQTISAYEHPPHSATSPQWVFETDDLASLDEAKSPDVPWATIVDHLTQTPTLSACTFVRFAGFDRVDQLLAGAGTAVRTSTAKVIDAPVYQLSSDATYGLTLDYFSGPKVALPPAPRATGTGDAIRISPPIFRSVGQTRKAVLAVRCRPTYTADLSVLVLDHDGSKEGNAPRLELIVAVNPARFLRILPFVLVLGFAASSLAISDFQESMRLLAGIAKLAGALMVGLGVWWGFRRLPGV